MMQRPTPPPRLLPILLINLLLPLLLLATLSTAATPTSCQPFSHAGIDYADANLTTLAGPITAPECCAACQQWNLVNATQPGVAACMIGVWHNIGDGSCDLKASADKPFKGHLVIAWQAPPPLPVFRFSSIYSSHMVLQSAPAQAQVWGFCADDETGVSLQLDGGPAVSATIHRGPTAGSTRWSALLPATAASLTTHQLTATAHGAKQTLQLDDVLFGDVWVCSGQSNMAYALNGSNGMAIVHPPVNNSAQEIAAMRQYENLRLFRVGRQSGTAQAPPADLAPPTDGGSDALVVGWSQPCPPGGTSGSNPCRVDFSNLCYFFGRNLQLAIKARTGKDVPVGLIGSYVGGTADELWSSPDALAKCLDPSKPVPAQDSELWFGMIRPLLNTTIKGAVWWQGEADSRHPGGAYDGYNCTFPEMIADWRAKWHAGTQQQTAADFPFGLVQLNSVGNGSVYNNPADPPDNADGLSPAFGFAGLRWSQSATHFATPNPALPNVFMAVSFDTPDKPFPYTGSNGNHDPGCNVHSPYKQPAVGEQGGGAVSCRGTVSTHTSLHTPQQAARLARGMLPLAYGLEVDTTGPVFGKVERSGQQLVVTVDRLGSGALLPPRSKLGFEVLVDGSWANIPIAGVSGATVTLGPAPAHASKLRYAWYSNPCGLYCFQCAIYASVEPLGDWSGEESFLPLAPFVVDLES